METPVAFDPYDGQSWYFGAMALKDGFKLLMAEMGSGVFIVIDSISIPGDYLLVVRDHLNICPYVISRIRKNSGTSDGIGLKLKSTRYLLGDKEFDGIPSLIKFFMENPLGNTLLVRPSGIRKLEMVVALEDFQSGNPDDLAFKKDEILTILGKPEGGRWKAKNALGHVGMIPLAYVKMMEAEDQSMVNGNTGSAGTSKGKAVNGDSDDDGRAKTVPWRRAEKLQLFFESPANKRYARVIKPRTPGVYDETSLKLELGDIIHLTQVHIGGRWEGEIVSGAGLGGTSGKKGYFPFTHVELLSNYPPTVIAKKDKKQK